MFNDTSFKSTTKSMSEPNQDPMLREPVAALRTASRRDSVVNVRVAAVRAVLFSNDLPAKRLAEHPMDIRTLSNEDRAHLLTGCRISIIADGNIIIRRDVPVRALMVSSTKLYDLLQVKPKVTQFRIHGKVNHKSINHLLDIFTTSPLIDAAEIELVGDNFTKDVLMYQACLSLGIYYVHVKPLLNALRAEITARLLSVEEMNTIVNRIAPTDPLFKHLANSLCHRRFEEEIADIAAFEKWLGYDSKKALQTIMVEIDQEHKRRRGTRRTRLGAASKNMLALVGEHEKEKEE